MAVGRTRIVAELVEEFLGAGDEGAVRRLGLRGPIFRLGDLIGFSEGRFGLPSLHRLVGGERLLVELDLDQVALPCGFSVAVLGGESEPFIGCGQVLRHANPVLGEDAEIVLAVGDAAIGSFAEPLGGVAIVRRPLDALSIKDKPFRVPSSMSSIVSP